MTKYKKLTRSSFVIVALCLALVGILAFGGTYAYFSANASASGTVTMGTLKVVAGTSASVTGDTTKVVPNQQIISQEFKTTGTDIKYYARLVIELTVSGTKSGDPATGECTVAELVTLGGLDGLKEVDGGDDKTTYYYVATDGTNASILSSEQTYTVTGTINKKAGHNGSDYYMGATITYKVSLETIQAEYLASSGSAGSAMAVTDLHAAWDKVVDSTYSAS